jgi:hypothetical protein
MDTLRAIGDSFRGFFGELFRSCYDMEFYRGVRTRPWQESLRYFVAMIALLVGVAVLCIAPFGFAVASRLGSFLDDHLPANTELDIASGKLSTTLPARFNIGDKDFPVLVDPSVTGIDAVDQAPEEGMLVGRDAIFMSNGKEKRVYPLAGFPDGKLSKADALDWLKRWSGPFLGVGIAVMAVAWYVGLLMVTSIYVLIASLAAMLAGKLFQAPLRYGQWVAVGFHAITLPIVADWTLAVSGLRVPFAYSFIFFMFVAAVLADERTRPTGPGDAAPARPAPRRIARRAPPKRAARPKADKE